MCYTFFKSARKELSCDTHAPPGCLWRNNLQYHSECNSCTNPCEWFWDSREPSTCIRGLFQPCPGPGHALWHILVGERRGKLDRSCRRLRSVDGWFDGVLTNE